MFGLFEKKSLALFLSDHSFYALALKGEPQSLVVESLIQQALPPSIVEGGFIKEPALLMDIMKKSIHEAKPSSLKQKEATIILPEELTYEYTFMLNKEGKETEIDQLIKNHISSRTPLSIDGAIYDYVVTHEADTKMVFVVLASKKIIQSYCDFFKKIGITITAVEPESVSLLRNIEIPKDNEGLTLLVFRKNMTLNWFLFSNNVLLESIIGSVTSLDAFANDVKKTVAMYSKKMTKPLKNVLLSGSMVESNKIIEMLEKYLDTKIKVENKFKISIAEMKSLSGEYKTENYVFSKLNIMLGACVRNYMKRGEKQLNLLH